MSSTPGGSVPYLCLSYVWGEPPDDKSGNASFKTIDSLTENLPETVSDAMHVAHKLGYRYL